MRQVMRQPPKPQDAHTCGQWSSCNRASKLACFTQKPSREAKCIQEVHSRNTVTEHLLEQLQGLLEREVPLASHFVEVDGCRSMPVYMMPAMMAIWLAAWS